MGIIHKEPTGNFVLLYYFFFSQLAEEENVKGVVTMNEAFETKRFVNTKEVRQPVVIRQRPVDNQGRGKFLPVDNVIFFVTKFE